MRPLNPSFPNLTLLTLNWLPSIGLIDLASRYAATLYSTPPSILTRPAPEGTPCMFHQDSTMDIDFTLDTDHRKRRRNRTTQSCLNCHTSKRKCDRKRPCQRCIQLGLTGLCVYEIDDPALRDDPTVDENTRLRNRIAELESLVRELRGKPHPRWADAAFRNDDPNEKWHSRATKCAPLALSSTSSALGKRRLSLSSPSGRTILPPIKTEADLASATSALYRFSEDAPTSAPPRFFDAGAGADDFPGSEDNCPCRSPSGSSPALTHTYISLSHSLENALSAARHAHGGQACALYRRMLDLARILPGPTPTPSSAPPQAYDLTGGGGSSTSGTPPLPDSAGPPNTASSTGSGSTSASASASNSTTNSGANPNPNPNPILSPLSSTASFSNSTSNPTPGPGSPHSSSAGGSPAFHHAHPHAQAGGSSSAGAGGGGGSPGEWSNYGYFHDVGVGVGVGVGHVGVGGVGVGGMSVPSMPVGLGLMGVGGLQMPVGVGHMGGHPHPHQHHGGHGGHPHAHGHGGHGHGHGHGHAAAMYGQHVMSQ
ncbi:Zn(2)-C6 fungal-type domain-containing protein [Mycena kentingensis (nom. inval.)]|nr:Zn(2)-C6 fungal-type domain-containing protein [Mycena kentingensis (nom. inval.)]